MYFYRRYIKNMETLKTVGALAGCAALIWNILVYVLSRRGKLDVSLGWGSDPKDMSTYFYIDVVNKGSDTRMIDNVSLVYLDKKQLKNSRISTVGYITELPNAILKRGEKKREIILYKNDAQLKELFFNHKILFRVEDTFGKKYDSTKLNDGVFSLPDRVDNINPL